MKWLEYAEIIEIDENDKVHFKEVPTSQDVEEKLPPEEKIESISETIINNQVLSNKFSDKYSNFFEFKKQRVENGLTRKMIETEDPPSDSKGSPEILCRLFR